MYGHGGWVYVSHKKGKNNAKESKAWHARERVRKPKAPYYVCQACKAWVFCHKADDQSYCRCGSTWAGGEQRLPAVNAHVDRDPKADTFENEKGDKADSDVEAKVKAWCDHQVFLGIEVKDEMVDIIRAQMVKKAQIQTKPESEVYRESRARLVAASKAHEKADKLRQALGKQLKEVEARAVKLKAELQHADKQAEEACEKQAKCLQEHKKLGKCLNTSCGEEEPAGMDVSEDNKGNGAARQNPHRRADSRGAVGPAAKEEIARSRSRGRHKHRGEDIEHLLNELAKEDFDEMDDAFKYNFENLKEQFDLHKKKRLRKADEAAAVGGSRASCPAAAMDSIREKAKTAAEQAVGGQGGTSG